MSKTAGLSAESRALLRALAEFRYQLRTFLHRSETVAQAAHLQPQQHQLLLQIAGIAEDRTATIAYAAERLGLRPNSTVELVNRSAAEGLIERAEALDDRRKVLLRITPKGEDALRQLSNSHAHELDQLVPAFLEAVRNIDRAPAVKAPPQPGEEERRA